MADNLAYMFLVTQSLSLMCGFKYGDKGVDDSRGCFVPYLILSSIVQIWWVFTVVRTKKHLASP